MNEHEQLKQTLDGLAARIRERRKALGLTQEKLAERAGLSVNFLAQLEISYKMPSLRTLVLLASALEADISDLFPASRHEKWYDEVDNLLRSLQDMKESDVRFIFDQLQATINYLKWQRAK